MNRRTKWTLAVLGSAVITAGIVSQMPKLAASPPTLPVLEATHHPEVPGLPSPPRLPPTIPAPVQPEAIRRGESIETLISRIEELRAKKADLDRQEQQTTAELHDQLKRQSGRLRALKIEDPPGPVPSKAVEPLVPKPGILAD
ncbi:MAG: hypothetical protein ACRC7O_09960 [Fimbriiglobus sp.]